MTSEAKSSPERNPDATLAHGQILHRVMQDDSGQDYYVYRSSTAGPAAPLCALIHYNTRDAKEQIEIFSEVAERYGAVLVAPHFAMDRHPDYQRLGRIRRTRAGRNAADVALTAIVEEVANLLELQAPRIHLFGYAAGGRFALRYAMAHPQRVAGAAIASAGSYTFPDPEKRFPRGISPRSAAPDLKFDPEKFLRVPITIFENRQARPRIRRRSEPADEAQRSGREQSGRAWVAAMKAAATQHGIEAAFSYRELARTSESFKGLVESAALPNKAFQALLGPPPELKTSSKRSWSGKVKVARPAPELPEGEQDAPERGLAQWRRFALPVALVAVLIGSVAPLLLWVNYRFAHVVSQDAVVRGHIADVGARVDGVVSRVEVDSGDRVHAGQILVRLQDEHFAAKVRQARAQLEKAKRELEVEQLAIENEALQLNSRLREVSALSASADAEHRATGSLAEEALRRLLLQRSLADQGLLAEEQVRIASTEYRTALARVTGSESDRNAAEAAQELAAATSEGLSVRHKRLSVLESEISTYEAELAIAEANLEGAVIRAPDDGAVVRRIVEPGGATVVGQPILSLWMGNDIWVEAWVDEGSLADVKIGGQATVTINSYPDREFSGIVETISVSTDSELPDSDVPQPRSERMRDAPVIAVRIRLIDAEEDLFPGLSAVVAIRKQDG